MNIFVLFPFARWRSFALSFSLVFRPFVTQMTNDDDVDDVNDVDVILTDVCTYNQETII